MQTKSLRKAVDEKCKDCVYDSANGGTWLAQTEACTCEKSCPLWPFRPVTAATRRQRAEGGIRSQKAKQRENFKKNSSKTDR